VIFELEHKILVSFQKVFNFIILVIRG